MKVEVIDVKKDKIKNLSIIFMIIAFVSLVSFFLVFVYDISKIFDIIFEYPFFVILFFPIAIVIYVCSVVGIIGVPTYFGITIIVLNIIKLCRNINNDLSVKLNIFNICTGFGIILISGCLYFMME